MLALLAIICTGGVKAQTIVFQETFDNLISTGGNDGSWETSVGGNELSYNDSKLDNVWGNFSKIYPCNKCVKFASKKASGKAVTPVIKATGDFVLSFKAGALKGKNATLTISVSDGTLAAKSFALTAEKFSDYSVKITGVTKDFAITFNVPQQQQSLLDEIKVVAVGVKETTTTTFGTGYDGKIFTFTDGVLEGFTAPTATWTPAGVGGSVAYSSSDKDIVTVDNGGKLNFTNTKFGTATITATFTPRSDQDKYATSTATYTVINTHIYNSIADLKKAITSTSTTNPDELKVNLTDAVVTYVNGDNTFIQDATAGILIFGVDGFAVGDKFTGKVVVKAYKYWGLPEITGWTAAADMVKTTGADIPVKEVTLAELQDDAYESMRVKVVGVTATKAFESRKATLKQGDVTIELYDKVKDLDITANSVYDIIGYPGIYNTIRQLTVWSQDNIMAHHEADKADPEIAFKETEKTVELKEGAIELSTLISNPHELPITYTSSNAEIAEVSKGVIYMYKTGKVDITAKFAGNDTYNAAEKTLALTIEDNRADAGIHFEKDSYTADINKEDFDGAVLVNPNKLTVTYSINATDKNVQIDDKTGYVMYPSGTEASYVVTAKFSGDDTYKPVTATYTLNVTDPNYEVKIVTFDATVDKGTSSSTSNIGADKLSKNGITIYGERSLFGNGTNYRFYRAVKGNTAKTTISVDKGNIVKIEFTNNNETSLNKLVFNNGYTYDTETKNSVWVGKSNSISFTTDDATVSATKITVTVKVPVAKDFTLDEKEVNEIEDWENSNVTVKRTFYADGGWNTLCLPFSLTDEQTKAAFGDDVELRTLESVSGNTLTFAQATGITAGVPCLIKVSKVAKDNTYTFTGVTTIAVKDETDFGFSEKGDVVFVGIYSPADVSELATAGKENALFLGAANKFYKAKAGTPMKAFRAFFLVPASTDTQALRAVIDGTTTGIDDLNIDTVKADGRVYNLNGQCVGYSLEGLKAGIYIQNGKKVIKK